MQALLRAGVHTFPASDTLWGVENFLQREGHQTGFFTGQTGGTPFLFPMSLYQTEPVEPAINRSQRAQTFAERRDFRIFPKQKYGTDAQQRNQHHIFSIFYDVVIGQALFPFEDGDFVQEILYQSKGAQPAADETPQQTAEQEEKPREAKKI